MNSLLILVSYFPDENNKFIGGIFVKHQLEYIKKKFKKVYVISMVPYIPKFLVKLPFFKHREKQTILKDYSYDNVYVHYIYYITLPIDFFRRLSRVILFKKVKKYIEKNKISFDLIHAHFTHPAGYIGKKLKDLMKKPLILTVHEDSIFLSNEIKRKDPMLEAAWKNSDYIIRINKKDVKLLRKFNKKIITIPNGFDDKKIKPMNKTKCRKELGLEKDKKIIFTLSGLVRQKGHIYAIDAVKKVIDSGQEVLYFIAGSGPLKNSIQNKIKKLGIERNVKLLGFLDEREVPIWFNASDIFLLSSLHEGNPTVMFEALGCGRPFIGTNVGGIPEVIVNSRLGLLSNPANSDELAKVILKSFKKKWDYNYIHNYAKRFTWKNISKQIIHVYKRCLNE